MRLLIASTATSETALHSTAARAGRGAGNDERLRVCSMSCWRAPEYYRGVIRQQASQEDELKLTVAWTGARALRRPARAVAASARDVDWEVEIGVLQRYSREGAATDEWSHNPTGSGSSSQAPLKPSSPLLPPAPSKSTSGTRSSRPLRASLISSSSLVLESLSPVNSRVRLLCC